MPVEKPGSVKETKGNIRAEAYLENIAPGQWPGHVVLKDAYTLLSSYDPAGRKPLSGDEVAQAQELTAQLRAELESQIRAQGWQPVAKTKDGLPIWRKVQRVSTPEKKQEIVTTFEGSCAPFIEDVVTGQVTTVTFSEQKQEIAALPTTTPEPTQRPYQLHKRYMRPVTFTCQWCEREVTELRFPSHTPLYCDNPDCKKKATRDKAQKRQAAWRAAHPDSQKKKKTGVTTSEK